MSTLNVSFEQKLMPKIWPEDLGTRFLERLNRMVDSIVNILIGIVTNSLVVLVRVIEYIIYAIIVLLPIIIAWRLLRPLHRRFTRNE